MVDAIRGQSGFISRFTFEEANKLNELSGLDDTYIPEFLEEYGGIDETRAGSGVFEGMIFMSNGRTKKECFRRKLFGLPGSYASIVKHVKPGMKLFLFEYERREMHGIFEAITSGAMNIEPDAFKGSVRQFPAQVRFRRVWDCYPLSENDFKKAISENYHTRKEFYFALSGDQVSKLIDLFGQQKIELRVSVGADYDEESYHLSRTDVRHETAGFCREIERNTSERDLHAGDTMYGHYNGEQELVCTRESHSKGPLCAGNVYAGQTMHDISNAGQMLPSTGGLRFDLCNESFYAGRTIIDISDADQRLGSHYVQLTNSGNFDRLNSENQSYYVRHSNFVESIRNAFAPRDTAMNANNVDEEIYDNNYRELFLPSNSQCHDNPYYDGTRMSHNPLSLDSLPLVRTKPVIEMSNIEDSQELRQVNLTNSPANHVSNSSRLYADDFYEDDHCFPKQSVFSRLKRVPEIGVLHEQEPVVFRQTHQTDFPQQKHKRKFKSLEIDEIESSGKQDEIMSDAESTDEPTFRDGIVINFKRRSQVSKYGKETTLQVEGKTNPNEGEQNSNKRKRRKLIRPQFDTVKVYENTMDVIQSCSKECPSQFVLPRTAILDDKKKGSDSRQESGLVLANVTEHSDCCNVQPVEVKNKCLDNLDAIQSCSKECPIQLVLPRSASLDDKKKGADSRQESRVGLANVTQHSDCCNVQPMEVKNKGLANLDVIQFCSKECPSQLVLPRTAILDDKKEGSDSRQESGVVLTNVTEHSDCCNVQTVEVENKGLAIIDVIQSCSKECPSQLDLPRITILDDKKEGSDSRQESGVVLTNVTEYSDCCNVQPMEVKNKGLANLGVIQSCSKECPSQLVLPRTAILDDKKEGSDSRQESGVVLENVTEHSDCCNVHTVEVKNKGLTNLDGSESYTKECPCQLVCSSSKILATQNAECDCGQENGNASSNKRECVDSCNFQVMGEFESKDITMLDLNNPLSDQTI